VCWSARFHSPVKVPNGKPLQTLADARKFLLKLPESERRTEVVQAVIETVLMAAMRTGHIPHAQASMIALIQSKAERQSLLKNEL
jgi:hypothetical protein